MRIAVISDIHGNDLLCGRVADSQGDGVDQIVCCGDTLQGGVRAEAIRRLKLDDRGMGNADDILLKGNESETKSPPTNGSTPCGNGNSPCCHATVCRT